jgi:hypothetical protein
VTQDADGGGSACGAFVVGGGDLVGGAVARRREACGLGRCVGVSCFLGRLQVLAGQVSGEPCVLEGLVRWDWLGERLPPV